VDHEVLGHGDGPEKRYRAFRRILRGVSRVVIGNRSAAFAPVQDLRLAILVDGDDDLLVEPRAPYPHIRAVLQARSATEHCALLLLSSSLGTEVAMLARTGYLHLLEPVPQPPHEVRPQIRLMDEYLRSREGPSGSSRMPREALAVIRRGLEHGPVLVQVPRSGYLPAVACTFCGTRCRCPTCAAALVMDGGGGILHCPVCGKREDGYRCPECHRTHLRALVIGAGRTAEELGRAFPEADLVVAGGAQGPLADAQVPSRGIVVATPGAEPAYPGGSAGSDGTVDGDAPAEDPGFAAAVLLDADALPARAAYDADVEAVRRWRNAIALVRPARLGGEVLVVGTATLPAIRDLVAHRSGAFVERVLADRELLGLPPFTRVCELVGDRAAVRDYLSATSLPDGVEVFGPVDLPTDEDRITTRAVLRLPIGRSRELADAIRAGIAARTARKAPGSLRARLDPPDVF
jgi:primosomal protein N' (replication factor Y)